MEYIAKPARTREILQEYGLDPKKGLGQNFLIDLNYLDKIITAAELSPGEKVVEIGPGIGSLTQFLLEEGVKVLTVEKDRRAVAILQDLLEEYIERGSLQVINGDALELPWAELNLDEGFRKIVANLPYNIATPLITRLLEELSEWQLMVFMVQREVGERMMAHPGTKSYGSLSIAVQYSALIEQVALVPPTVFYPRPRVESIILRFRPRLEPPVDLLDRGLFCKLVKAAFHQRRKTLKNSLTNSPYVQVSAAEVEKALAQLHLDLRIRGEKLSLEEFGHLANIISQSRTCRS
ncbi:MAG: 16S rRNA (adenine(1518)-N(6)/adenine(1519)-N(6))-dimethyltransferase RsmA [Halanaerobium sp.]|nr:16S rRNA (adenine(1518)-N(6)/adenine(1519)-N(6))-dimethyltransferase RsmA [Halanaerobium sp.]